MISETLTPEMIKNLNDWYGSDIFEFNEKGLTIKLSERFKEWVEEWEKNNLSEEQIKNGERMTEADFADEFSNFADDMGFRNTEGIDFCLNNEWLYPNDYGMTNAPVWGFGGYLGMDETRDRPEFVFADLGYDLRSWFEDLLKDGEVTIFANVKEYGQRYSGFVYEAKPSLENNDEVNLIEKEEMFREFLQDEVFKSIRIPYGALESFDEHSMIFDEPCLEEIAQKAKDKLEELGYEVAIFEKYKRINPDVNKAFVFAEDASSLNTVCEYMQTQGYELTYGSHDITPMLKNDGFSLKNKKEMICDFLNDKVFEGKLSYDDLVLFDENSIIFAKPCNEFFDPKHMFNYTLKATKELKELGYEFIGLENDYLLKHNENERAFIFATNSSSLVEPYLHMFEQGYDREYISFGADIDHYLTTKDPERVFQHYEKHISIYAKKYLKSKGVEEISEDMANDIEKLADKVRNYREDNGDKFKAIEEFCDKFIHNSTENKEQNTQNIRTNR